VHRQINNREGHNQLQEDLFWASLGIPWATTETKLIFGNFSFIFSFLI
jgi:hypothetical protein